MADLYQYKCPNCGGNVKYSPASGFECESCGSVFEKKVLDDYKAAMDLKNGVNTAVGAAGAAEAEAEAETLTDSGDYNWSDASSNDTINVEKLFKCQSCGAEVVGDATTVASQCPYCGSPVVVMNMTNGINKPDFVIPFKLDEKQAGEALKSLYKGKHFIPKAFSLANKIKEIKPMYVPFWLFDCNAEADCLYDATRVSHWSDSSYNYTRTEHYDARRSGTMRFDRVPVDGSFKMDDAYMDSIEPFDYSGLLDFDPAYLSGYLANKYDMDAKACFPRAEERIKQTVQSEFAKTVTGYHGVTARSTNIKADNGSYRYALLPVYMVTTKYNGKLYTFAINGQTGKVTGQIPCDKGKYWLTFAAIAAAIIAVAQFLVL